jgi:hypothetical protein
MDAKCKKECACSKKDKQLKELAEQNEILLSALKQIEMMGNETHTKEAIFANMVLNRVLKS